MSSGFPPIVNDLRAARAPSTATWFEGVVHELSGDVAWGFDELASAFASALGREVTYQPLTPDEHRQALLDAGLDEGTAGFVVALDQNIAAGLVAVTTGDLRRLPGRPTVPLGETVSSWSR